ncbi:hypothetical protein RGQ29_030782 [Quercus rubra]|uniref:TIR domain-containing protein n=1 Tax=Quercus rubra TaxID=3512 RepID=A0AAN7IIG3_QUERU|nr:hypothetical protein RGQ29_030782 [Quercus rubra]
MAFPNDEGASTSFTHLHDGHDVSYEYDVYLSFRGEDTRYNFTSHLYEALSDKGLNTFHDDDLVRGDEISDALCKGCKSSHTSVIVLSQNYAFSPWCLDELVMILEQREKNGQLVLPIFYKVNPSEVRKQLGNFDLINIKFSDGEEKVKRWKEALTKVANLSGWHFEEGYVSK